MGLTENLIQHDLGCGIFQAVVVPFVYWLPMLGLTWSIQMMAFGSYNPGWLCADIDTVTFYTQADNISKYGPDLDLYHHSERGNSTIISSKNWTRASANKTFIQTQDDESCAYFKQCRHVVFSSDASTIVTEWGLICDKAFVIPLIISIHMVGFFFGSLFSSSLADMIGRKKTFYGSLFSVGLLNSVSIFSISWEMFAAIRCLQGMASACVIAVCFIYSSEFVTRKWRAPLSGSPVVSVSATTFGLIIMQLKDWKYFLALSSLITLLCCLPCIWIPESLRWLEVKNKSKEFRAVVKKIAKVNRKLIPRFDSKDLVTEATQKAESDFSTDQKPESKSLEPNTKKMKKYTFVDIFRPGYKVYSITVGVVWLLTNCIIFSIAFGIKVLGGNFYTNLILISAVPIPFQLFPIIAPNIIGRKRAIFVCFALVTVCLFIMLLLAVFVPAGNSKNIGTLALVMCVMAGIDSSGALIMLMITEIYPTVVRGVALSWGSLVARIGAIIAPFLIPRDGSSEVFVWYSTLGAMGLICCCLIIGLPETKGKPLKETFDDVDDNSENNVNVTACFNGTQAA